MSRVKRVLLIAYINNSWGNWEIASYRFEEADNKNDNAMENDNANIIKRCEGEIKINYK